MKLIIAITGATGVIYGIRLLEILKNKNIETNLIITNWAEKIIKTETEYSLKQVNALALHCYKESDLNSSIASGSYKIDSMIVVPCSMKTLSAIANGYSENLVGRAADVVIKERRKLILVPREIPLSPIHIENMLKLAKLGVIILPPIPAFYNRPASIKDIVDHVVSRILDNLGIDNELFERWGNGRKENI